MVDFTRQAPKVTAPPTPNLQTNQGSLAGDLIQAASFGLNLFGRQQQVEAQQAIADNKVKLGEATEAVIRFENAQDIEGVNRERAVDKYIKEAASTFGVNTLELRDIVSKFRGRTTAEGIRIENKARLDEETAQALKAQQDRTNLEEEVAELDPFISSNAGIEAASNEELSLMKLEGLREKAARAAESSQLKLEEARAASGERKSKIKIKQFESDYLYAKGSQLNKTIKSQLAQVDKSDPKQVNEFLDTIRMIRTGLPNDVRAQAREQGLVMSVEEINGTVNAMSVGLTQLEDIAKRKDLADLSNDQISIMTNNVLLTMSTSEDEDERIAASAIMLAKAVGAPPELGNFNKVAFRFAKQAMLGNTTDAAAAASREVGNAGGSEGASESISKFIKDTVRNSYLPVNTPDGNYRTSVTNSLVGDFAAPRAKLEKMVREGVFLSHLEGLAGEMGSQVTDPERRDEILEAMNPVVTDVIRSTARSFLLSPQDTRRFRGMGDASMVATKGKDNFLFDTNTMQVVPKANLGRQNVASKKLNKILSTTLKAYENLGFTEEEMDELKAEITNSFAVIVTGGELEVEE